MYELAMPHYDIVSIKAQALRPHRRLKIYAVAAVNIILPRWMMTEMIMLDDAEQRQVESHSLRACRAASFEHDDAFIYFSPICRVLSARMPARRVDDLLPLEGAPRPLPESGAKQEDIIFAEYHGHTAMAEVIADAHFFDIEQDVDMPATPTYSTAHDVFSRCRQNGNAR